MNNLKLIAIVFVICTFHFAGLAQKPPIKFGKISDEEINLKVYDKDTSAEAVIIADYGTVEIVYPSSEGFQLQVNRHRRIKILKNDGLERANGSVRLYRSGGSDENLSSFKASTYNLEDGKLIETKFSRKEIISENESKYAVLKKFALPNVKVGSIIEYEYSYVSPHIFNLRDWYFQDEIPSMWSELRTTIPEFFDFRRATGGYLVSSICEKTQSSFAIQGSRTNYSNYIERVVFQDVPAFKHEKFITTPNDYLSRVEFELRSLNFPGSPIENYSTTWEKIVGNLMADENFGADLNRHGIVKELTGQINNSDSLMAKINKAVELIKRQMKWDESYSVSTDRSLREAFNKKQGNMAEINLLLINLLRSVGVDAYPVIFSTRSHGTIRLFYPMISAFNGVLVAVKVNGKDMLIDATSQFNNLGQISPNYVNGNGMKIMENRFEWIPLLNTEQYSTITMTTLNVVDGQLKGEIIKNNLSSSASDLREEIAKKGKQQFIDEYIKETTDLDIKEYIIDNESDLSKPLSEKVFVDNFNKIDVTGDVIYVPSVVGLDEEINPFVSDTRLYPVDFAVPVTEKNIINLNIPGGYQVEELPAEIKLSLPGNAATFIYMVRNLGTTVQVSSTLKINRTLFTSQEYQLLKEFFKNIISKYGEQIVLKKV